MENLFEQHLEHIQGLYHIKEEYSSLARSIVNVLCKKNLERIGMDYMKERGKDGHIRVTALCIQCFGPGTSYLFVNIYKDEIIMSSGNDEDGSIFEFTFNFHEAVDAIDELLPYRPNSDITWKYSKRASVERSYDAKIEGNVLGREITIYDEGGHSEEQADYIVKCVNNYERLLNGVMKALDTDYGNERNVLLETLKKIGEL